MGVDESIEVTAPSVEEAIIVGLTRLMVTRDEVEIEVLDEGSKGFLGIGAREARVRLTRGRPRPAKVTAPTPVPPVEKPAAEMATDRAPAQREAVAEPVDAAPSAVVSDVAAPEPARVTAEPEPERVIVEPVAVAPPADDGLDREKLAEIAREIMVQMVPGLDIVTTIEWVDEDRPTLWVSVSGKDADALVGPRARNLHAVQYLFRALIYRQLDGDYNVVVDADGYRKRRRRSLESMAQSKANQAVEQGRTVRLRAMPPHERRIVHMTLREDERVSTSSAGKGRDRAVTIVPKKQ